MAKQEEGKKKKGAAPAVEAAPAGKPSRPKLNNEASARLRHKYQKEVVPSLMKELGLKNVMAVPRLEKVVVNMVAKVPHLVEIVERPAGK